MEGSPQGKAQGGGDPAYAMSMKWPTVTRRIIRSVEAPDYDTRVSTALRMPTLLVLSALFAFALAELYVLWRMGWGTGSDVGWPILWFVLICSAAILVVQYFSDVRKISGREPSWDSDVALIVRAAVIAGDDSIAPLAQTPPTITADWRVSADSTRVAGLYRPERLIPLDSVRTTAIWVNLVVNGAGIVEMLFLQRIDPRQGPMQVIALESLPIVLALGMLIQRLWLSRPFSVTVDAHGLTWRRGLKRRALLWSEAQALCIIELPPASARPSRPTDPVQRIYWLQGPDEAFIWASRPCMRWFSLRRAAGGDNTARLAAYDVQASSLCALAAAHTGLPLRDVTVTAARLTQLWPRLSVMLQSLTPRPSVAITEAARLRIVSQRARRRRRLWAIFGAGVTLNILLLVAALALLIGVPRAYGDQLNQAQQRAPIFADTLMAPSGQWPDAATSSGAVFTYFDDAYTTVAYPPCCNLLALARPTVDDGVVEVTLRQMSDLDLTSAGLVLRANQTTHRALVFSISSSGEWQLRRFSLSADGYSGREDVLLMYQGVLFSVGAIHRGPGATNRLAVIMRGANYTFFVNGQYLGSYHDDQGAGGQTGVYTDGSGAAEFRDFAVYPAPSAVPWLPM